MTYEPSGSEDELDVDPTKPRRGAAHQHLQFVPRYVADVVGSVFKLRNEPVQGGSRLITRHTRIRAAYDTASVLRCMSSRKPVPSSMSYNTPEPASVSRSTEFPAFLPR